MVGRFLASCLGHKNMWLDAVILSAGCLPIIQALTMIGKFSIFLKSNGSIRLALMFYIPMNSKVCSLSLMVTWPIMTIFLLEQERKCNIRIIFPTQFIQHWEMCMIFLRLVGERGEGGEKGITTNHKKQMMMAAVTLNRSYFMIQLIKK